MNPADLNINRSDGLLNLETTPTSNGAPKSKSATVPRIDTEPIYTQLRAALGDHFAEYKSALGNFFLGTHTANKEVHFANISQANSTAMNSTERSRASSLQPLLPPA